MMNRLFSLITTHLFIIIFFTLITAEAQATVRFVAHTTADCGSLSPCYTTIQAAINNSVSNDIVQIEPSDSPYQENVTFPTTLSADLSLTLTGVETARTVLRGSATGAIITVDNPITSSFNLSVTVRKITFENNTTAIHASNKASLIATNCIFQNLSGTAVVLSGLTAAIQVNNNVFYNNQMGISRDTTTSSIINNIFFGNTTAFTVSLSTTGMSTNDYFSNVDDATAPRETSAIKTDPLFVNATNGDFHLKTASPCIDTGDATVGNDSVDGSLPDIGAYGGSNSDIIPSKISGLAMTGTTGNSITVTWNTNNCYLITDDNKSSPTNPHGYRLYYGSSTSGNYNGTDAGGGSLPSPVTLDLHNNVGAFPPYTLAGLSPPMSSAPAAPILLQIIPANQSLELAWTPVFGATGYKVHYGISSPTENEVPVGNATSFTLQGLTNRQVYQVAVSAFVQTTYFLAITAFDNANTTVSGLIPGENHESAFSPEVSVALGIPQESGLSNVLTDFPEAIVAYPNLPRKGCFIATAAYGGADAPAVRALRDFRDRYLLMNAPGRAFVRWYYEHSPAAAKIINDHPWLKPVVRTALAPAVGVAMLMTETNGPQKFLVLLVLFSIAVWLMYRKKLGLPGDRR